MSEAHETAVLFRNVELFALDVPGGSRGPTDVLVRGARIAAIGEDATRSAPADVRIVEGRGHLLMPGLINGHFHSPVNHMKGSLPSLPLELFMLYESPAFEALRPTPREAYVRTMLGAVEMLRSGVTAVQDDAFFVPEPAPEIIDAVMQAYADSGIRATVALDQPELAELEKLPFLADLLPDDMRAELARPPEFGREQLLEAYAHLIGTWHGREEGRLAAAVSCSAPQRVSPEYFAELEALSRARDLPFYAHMLETKLQRVLAHEQPRFAGRSLVRYTADLGLLSERMNVIHAIWVDEADLDLIAEAGAVIAHNPVSNLRLGSGVMPFRAIRDRNIPICLGIDEAIADDSVNLWGVLKAAGLVHNISGSDAESWPRADEILHAATLGGARAMRREKRTRHDRGRQARRPHIDRPRHARLHPAERPAAPAGLLRERLLGGAHHGRGQHRLRSRRGHDRRRTRFARGSARALRTPPPGAGGGEARRGPLAAGLSRHGG